MQCGLRVSCREGEVLLTVPAGLVFGRWEVADFGVRFPAGRAVAVAFEDHLRTVVPNLMADHDGVTEPGTLKTEELHTSHAPSGLVMAWQTATKGGEQHQARPPSPPAPSPR